MSQSIVVVVIIALLVVVLASSVKIIHQQKIGLVERLGKFNRRLAPGPHVVIPIIDRVQYNLDMREQVVPFPPQGVITEDNLMVNIDSVIYFQIVDPERAAYEAQSYKTAIEQLTMTTLRNIIGGMDMEAALTSREEINQKLRAVLDEATGKWGIKVNRVELRAIEPPPTIRDAMEKGARAERDKRAAILLAEGERQSQILSAGGDRESAILRAQGDREAAVLRAQADRQAQMLRAEGEAQAITTVFNAIHAGQPDQGLLAYQYMQMLPTLARGDSNKVWVVPSELNEALKGLGSLAGGGSQHSDNGGFSVADPNQFSAPEKVDVFAEIQAQKAEEKEASEATVQQAIQEAAKLENPGVAGKRHKDRGQVTGTQAPAHAQVEAPSEYESAITSQGQVSAPQADKPGDQTTD
ncbi:SPFH domain-containing protein [Cutibacterium sp.]|uniref:SPFH domain-containing protein n=1 Tax=Cutibacterium sp. TaxID=1912221 RepID=UPI0026DBCA29|nr:SPFH domain-containing protein [Cutibacterium sp.]MDO4412994.1 SPFH domain-containing protein [Cutibacterium sp.]